LNSPHLSMATRRVGYGYLHGPIVFIGIQDEVNLNPIATRRSILLPPPSGDSDEDSETASDIPIGGVDSGSSSGDGLHSIDVSEEELLSNPDIFNDDPGAFCRPFSNPHRIVSERTFHTILRVEQPTVGSKPYVQPDIIIRETAPAGNNVAVIGAPAPGREDDVDIDNLSPDEVAEIILTAVRAIGAPASNTIFEAAAPPVEIDPAITLNPVLYGEHLLNGEELQTHHKVPLQRWWLESNRKSDSLTSSMSPAITSDELCSRLTRGLSLLRRKMHGGFLGEGGTATCPPLPDRGGSGSNATSLPDQPTRSAAEAGVSASIIGMCQGY